MSPSRLTQRFALPVLLTGVVLTGVTFTATPALADTGPIIVRDPQTGRPTCLNCTEGPMVIHDAPSGKRLIQFCVGSNCVTVEARGPQPMEPPTPTK